VLDFLVDLIFPQFCIGCQKFNTLLCEECFTKINFCSFAIVPEIENCHLENIAVMAEYEGITKKLITTLKYQSIKEVGQILAKIIYETTCFPQTNIIAAVPLHSKRKRQRGFNQAAEIAEELSLLTSSTYLPLLKRIKHSKPQAKITNKDQRLKHLNNTFEINLRLPPLESILIIDDVTTTGTTLNECAEILKKAGHNKIYGLVIAHGN